MSTTNRISRIAIPTTIAGCLLFVTAAAAQIQFSELARNHLPPDRDNTHALALGDVDGDGDLDLVLGNEGQDRLYLNDGSGTFTDVTPARMPPGGGGHAVALGDVDLDGDLDLAFQDRLYFNDGSGTFTDATSSHLPSGFGSYANSLALGDVDGDGDLDVLLAVGGYSETVEPIGCYSEPCETFVAQPNRLYLNDGNGAFAQALAGQLPNEAQRTNTVALTDVDSDGDLDAVIGNTSYFWCADPCSWGGGGTAAGPNRLYLNDGTGVFTDVTAAQLPPDSDDTQTVSFGDVDADGDVDLVFGNEEQNRLYLNDGAGGFTHVTASRIPPGGDGQSLALGDVDLDGDRDLVFQNRLCLNDGTGVFADATSSHLPSSYGNYAISVALGDVDADGDPDLVLGNGRPGYQNRLYVNDGVGFFVDANATRMPVDSADTNAMAHADVDLDGDLDLVCGNGDFSGRQNRLYLNDGMGWFTDATAARMPPDDDRTHAVAFADVDSDGDFDLFCGNDGHNRLYLNDGTGTFTDATSARMPLDLRKTVALAPGDVDLDGDMDLVLGNSGSFWRRNQLFLNDGTGTFTEVTASHMPTNADSTTALALGDVDRDGDPDLVMSNAGQQNRLYLNDGSALFTDATVGRMPVDGDGTRDVAMNDVDGDGDPDLVFGNGYPGYQNRLYLNDGAGVFTDGTSGHLPPDGASTRAVTLGDVDGDGDVDLICANEPTPISRSSIRLYVNDGTGTFIDATAARVPTEPERPGAQSLVLGDVDSDGDPDLVFGTDGQNRLYLNLLRQLDVPLLVRIGQPYQLDVYARYGPTGTVDTAVPFISTGTASIPVPPLGTFALDPAQMIRLPSFIIPQPEGMGSQSFVVPNLPALIGASVYAQALIAQYPVTHRLTNWTADVIMQ